MGWVVGSPSGRGLAVSDHPTKQTADPITSLVKLRAEVMHLAYEVDALSDARGIAEVRKRAPCVGERIRALVMRPEFVEACKR